MSDPEHARRLARLAHVGPELLSPIQRRSAKTQNGLALIRAREVAVETRTKIVNAVRGIVKSSGHRLPSSATSTFARKAKGACPGVLKPTLLPLLCVVEDLTRRLLAIRDEFAVTIVLVEQSAAAGEDLQLQCKRGERRAQLVRGHREDILARLDRAIALRHRRRQHQRGDGEHAH